MSKLYMLEVLHEMGGLNRVAFDNWEQADKQLQKLKAVMGTRFGKNAEETIEIISPAEKCVFVAGRISSAIVVDIEQRTQLEKENNDKKDQVDFERNKKHVEKMREAGMEEYIRFK